MAVSSTQRRSAWRACCPCTLCIGRAGRAPQATRRACAPCGAIQHRAGAPKKRILKAKLHHTERTGFQEGIRPRYIPPMFENLVTSRSDIIDVDSATPRPFSCEPVGCFHAQMSRSWSPAPQDVSNEDEECFHIEASEAPLKIGINAAAPPPASRVTAADGLHLHLNSRAKSGYTRVESLPDGRFRVAVDNAAQIACLRTACMSTCTDMHMHECMVFACAGARRRALRGATRHLLYGS